ncbi:DUF4129 domain-containing protein [Flavitalea sp. BT771]|uniref:DUF4129 domain-containing protein n=1 Tax=Flavitalea sp. BT771 TaxID=3063329 RepID=UPI0026E46A83|nr:DUF4129 domain-containing protein [Flavitalea sp. BT771]MDO6431217.1 DUF4129 domain-containing protein [Flavitalea sp. BT771]MDV6220124.1 DUF4129 domain-containing protein [Flavitalea sp. BT771]
MNPPLLHIKYYLHPAALTVLFLLAVLHSPAQRHGRRHATRHSASMPDSVNTADEEIRPFVTDTTTATIDGTEHHADTTVASEVTGATTAPPEKEEEPPLELRSIPDSTIRNLKKQRDFAYANDSAYWKRPAKDGPSDETFFRLLDSKAFLYFIYIFFGGVLVYALYKIISENNLRFFYKKPVKLGVGPLAEAELPEEDLDQLLKKAMDQRDHRLATRYLYLKTLRMLEARELIRWHIRSTDEEYARQMDIRPQGESFRRVMGAYERVWYGKFSLSDQQFARLLQYFQDFHTSIEHSRRA